MALTLGLQAAAQGAVTGMAEASVRALAKVVAVLPVRLRRRVETLRAATVPASWTGDAGSVDADALTTVAQACRDTERLSFTYTAADERRTDRLVEPHRLVALGRRWYLVAFDVDRADWRSFRLDRLAAPRGTGARFAPRRLPAEDAAEFVRAGIAGRAAPHVVEAVVAAPAAAVRARIGRWATVTELDAERCRVRTEPDDLDWAVLALGMAGAEFTVLSPPELAGRLRVLAARFTAAAEAPA